MNVCPSPVIQAKERGAVKGNAKVEGCNLLSKGRPSLADTQGVDLRADRWRSNRTQDALHFEGRDSVQLKAHLSHRIGKKLSGKGIYQKSIPLLSGDLGGFDGIPRGLTIQTLCYPVGHAEEFTSEHVLRLRFLLLGFLDFRNSLNLLANVEFDGGKQFPSRNLAEFAFFALLVHRSRP